MQGSINVPARVFPTGWWAWVWALASGLCVLHAAPTTNDFSGGAGLTPFATKTWGAYSGSLLQNGALRLTYTTGQSALVLFDRTAEGPHRRVTADFRLSCTTGADGFSFNLLATPTYGTNGVGPFGSLAAAPTPWEEPALTNSLAIGFDVYNPDDYQGLGPHEVSLHWNGVELAKRRSAVDFRTGGFRPVRVEVEFVPGGAEVTVKISGSTVYDREFIAGPVPFDSRVAFGARTGGLSFTSRLDDVRVEFAEPFAALAPAQTVRLFNETWIHGGNQTPERTVVLPAPERPWERVLLKLSLGRPPNGFDVFDRQMNFTVVSGGKRYEIARFITPFGQAGTWFADVTDFQSLLRDSRRFRAFIATYVSQAGGQYGSGWLVTADLLFYAGEPEWQPYQVDNLWNGEPRYGDPASPIAKFFTVRQPVIDAAAERVQVRLMVTGHGQSPNSENAAEFLVRGRTLTANGTSFRNVLWRNDCYLNPNRPQPGTWIYSRAGWCPGDRVDPWSVDISQLITPGQPVVLNYVADAYTNTSIDGGNPARHWVESQLVTSRRFVSPDPVLAAAEDTGELRLRWPAWGYRHGLWTADSLNAAAEDWTRVAQTPAVVGDEFVVTVPPAAGATRFYRLQSEGH